MIENAKQWEGQLLNGKFLLRRFLGGSDRSAVFLVEESVGGVAQIAIRLVDANGAGADEQLKQWEATSALRHPNLIRIFETGRCQVDGHQFFYALTEYAEENLAQIIPERALNAEEARQVLEGVLAALAYIHSQGLVHGSLKPSHVFAIGDTVKVSSNTLSPAGKSVVNRSASPGYNAPETATGMYTPASDVWSLGVTLTEALTQHLPERDLQHGKQSALPAGVPQPFPEIVENCLQPDPARRWTAAQIAGRVAAAPATTVSAPPAQKSGRTASSITVGRKQPAKWPYALALAVAVIVAVVLMARPKPPASQPAAPPGSEPNPAAGQPASGGGSVATSPSSVAPAEACCDGRVAERVKPQVSASALRTIQGRIRVQIEVDVDETGNVIEARFKSAGPSRYFAEKSLAAARKWKFKPPVEDGHPVASRWLVKFTLSSRAIDDSAQQIKP